jgi:hypothetical protein
MLRTIPPTRRRRRAPLLVVGLGALMLLATACHQDNTPQFYNSLTQDNFVQGCIGGSTNTTVATPSMCGCLYTQITAIVPASNDDRKAHESKYANYSGPNFQELNSQLKSDPSKVPTTVQEAWAQNCDGYTTTTSSGSSGGPTTTSTTKG